MKTVVANGQLIENPMPAYFIPPSAHNLVVVWRNEKPDRPGLPLVPTMTGLVEALEGFRAALWFPQFILN